MTPAVQMLMTDVSAVTVSLQVATEAPDELPTEEDFGHWVRLAIEASSATVPADACVTVRLVDAEEIARLNERFREIARPTNVLAFPAAAMLPVDDAEVELGDLIICLEVVRREADEQGKTLINHLTHLTLHGSLHLVGYDHTDDAEASAMEALETRLLAGLGIADPYEYRDAG